MIDPPRASLALDKLGIPHEVFRHAGIVASLEQAAHERGQVPDQVVRSLVFRIGAGEYMMVLAAGPSQISWRQLREVLGKRRLTMATEEEVLQVTGYQVGTVSPFGLPAPIRTLIDRRVLVHDHVSIGSGAPNTGIILSSRDLIRGLPSAELINL